MSKEIEVQEPVKEGKIKLHREISSLKKFMTDYKADRKANWKEFKNKMNDDIDRIHKSGDELIVRNKKQKK